MRDETNATLKFYCAHLICSLCQQYARTGPHPCDENIRWRNFAFTRKDATMSTGSISKYWPMQDFQEEISDPPLHK